MANFVAGFFIFWFVAECFLFVPLRTRTSRKIDALRDATGSPEWKAWQLAIMEPLFTTIATVMSLGFVGIFSAWPGVFVLPMLNLLLFAWLTRQEGRGCQRGRLVTTVLLTRFVLLCVASMLFITEGWIASAVFVNLALLLRTLFMLYQSRVTPELFEYEQAREAEEQAQMSRNIHTPTIEDGLGGLDLWNAQVDLIEQLKEEEMIQG